MSRFERLVPSDSTLARTVGTGLPTFPLGLTEEMVIVPPEPGRPPPPLLGSGARPADGLAYSSLDYFLGLWNVRNSLFLLGLLF